MTDSIQQTLETRGNNYGDFETLANVSQTLYAVAQQHYAAVHTTQDGTQAQLPPFMAESLRMIFHKIARVINGNPFYKDSWHDIGGYSELVVNTLGQIEERQQAQARAQAEAAKANAVTPTTTEGQ